MSERIRYKTPHQQSSATTYYKNTNSFSFVFVYTSESIAFLCMQPNYNCHIASCAIGNAIQRIILILLFHLQHLVLIWSHSFCELKQQYIQQAETAHQIIQKVFISSMHNKSLWSILSENSIFIFLHRL